MPFKSAKQRGYLLAHPEITDKKGRSVGRKWVKEYGGKVSKSGNMQGWLKPLAVGTIGGAMANQVPSFEEQQRMRENRRRRKEYQKAKVKKILVPAADDPDFNQEAAQQAFDLVMKMDDDTAEMFVEMVVGDYYEELIEKNLGTLQKHLNQVIEKQLTNLKQAHLRLVSKGLDSEQAIAVAQALALFEGEISKAKNPYETGAYHFKESDFRRDPGTGRFQTKITRRQNKELHHKTAEALLGVKTPTQHGGEDLSTEDRIRFQDEYRQLAQFLQAVDQSAGARGDQSVLLQYQDLNGDPFTEIHTGTKPPKDKLADPSYRLVGAMAAPTTLTAGGAAFGLSTALGQQMSPTQVQALNQAGAKGGSFAQQWVNAGDEQASNAKLYGRTAAAGELLGAIGPAGSKTQLAGKFAQIVGNAGPQAEMVLGPTARKTAYRYRGTEKTPDRDMVSAYGQGVAQGKLYAPIDTEDRITRGRERARHGSGKPGTAPAASQMGAARLERESRAPTWQERELGRQAVVNHLRRKMPQKSLYELQLASGNTPPSEGVIINADGQVATQAVGYGDDHYLPFNLKNLKALKGGEYIRTRSVGGLTSEDVYTGLISGARQVTVTSRSGTYTMTFRPDFRGGRRHNDKARRMTRRYEQLLDAVQSQQVERLDIDPETRQQIEREVRDEMAGPGWSQRDRMEAVKERIDEFKENPYITERDEARAEAQITHMTQGMTDQKQIDRVRGQVYDDLLEQKETRFRLNSQGYKAALDALQEQFPYYIDKPRWTPPRDAEQRIDTGLDRGYVEPGRNRPTAAAAGLFGVQGRGSKYAGKGNKFSAREADYQGGRSGHLQPVTGEPSGGGGGKKDEELTDKEKRAAAAEQIKRDRSMVVAAKKIQDLAGHRLDDDAKDLYKTELAYTEEDLRDPDKFSKFNSFANWLTEKAKDPTLKREWETAVGHREAKPYSRERATVFPKVPATFEDRAFAPGADSKRVTRALDEIDRKTRESPIHQKPYSALTESEHQELHNAFTEMLARLTAVPGTLDRSELEQIGFHPNSPGIAGLTSDKEKILDRMEQQQRARTLTSGMSDTDRAARAQRTVVHNQTKTQEEYDGPAKQAMKNAEYIHTIRRRVEDLPEDHDEDADKLRGLADAWENAVNEGHIQTPEQLAQFSQGHTEEMELVHQWERKLIGQGPTGTLRE